MLIPKSPRVIGGKNEPMQAIALSFNLKFLT